MKRTFIFLLLAATACSKKDSPKDSTTASGSAPTTKQPSTGKAPPPQPPALETQIAITSANVFFKAADGTVKSWGDRGDLLGDGAKEQRDKPTAVAQLAGTARLAIGGSQTMCAVMKDGTAKCWGNGASGELGNAKADKASLPTAVPGLANVADIAVGNYNACARLTDGTVTCWGNNGFHKTGAMKADSLVPPTPIPGVNAVEIALAGDATCARGGDGSVTCWGLYCGSENNTNCDKPNTVAALAGATSIAGGGSFVCAVAKDTTVKCFGHDNQYGALGNGTTTNSNKIETVKGLTGARKVVAASLHACALMLDGTVQCWGSNEHGQLGDGTVPKDDAKESDKARPTPAPVKDLKDVADLMCSNSTCCAQTTDKQIKCWGENSNGLYFGEANAAQANVPTPIAVKVD